MTTHADAPGRIRLTQYAHGGGCACKIPPGELEDVVARLAGPPLTGAAGRLVVGLESGDDLAGEVLRGGLDVAAAAGCHVAGGHSVDDPEPKYGMAVTGLADPDRLLRNDAGRPGVPLTLTKPLGIGVLNSRHKATGEVFPQAVEAMTTLNAGAARAALAAGASCATDVTGFGLLGHLHKLARASGVTAVLEAAAVPYLDGARDALAAGYVSGGTRRNLDWVRPHADLAAAGEAEALLLADAQTSGGLLVAGELPGHPVVGELVEARDGVTVVVR
jgi:selenide,water dikinase